MDQHGSALFAQRSLIILKIHIHAHVTAIHHLLQDDTLAAIVFNDDVEVDLLAEGVTRVVNKLVRRLVVLATLRRLALYLQFEEVIWANVLRDSHTSDVQLDVAIDHDEHAASGDLSGASILERVLVLNIVATLKDVVALQRHVLELGLELGV